ncbi:hypothetical protein HHI36_013506 [Cryptolaemus montrouzieri]|uniref:Serendipity locus protein alpha n=1 Tax=Cryptolaemus montrouzieri TaxID=559131 RepID=A0ABD2NHZ2_9CUCU
MDNAIKISKHSMKQVLNSSILTISSNFKNLTGSIGDLIVLSSDIAKSRFCDKSEGILYKSALMFHSCQLISSLKLLAKVINNEIIIGSVLKECRNSIHNRINFCLDTIGEIFNSDFVPINESGLFLKWVDDALEKITQVEIGNKTEFALKEAVSAFENVLSHAMSIAQICLNEDSKAIKGTSQMVLESIEELENELTKSEPNKAMVKLFIENSGNKLCSLERRVDIAILRLSLKIFSKYNQPLKEVFKICERNFQDEFNQQLIDDIVVDFDLHVDRIMQIGLFSVFCSSNIKSGIKIRDCMASLEFLETELIPSALMLLTDNSEVNRMSSSIYKNYWLDEAKELKKLIFEIIDPYTFCQVIYDEICLVIDGISEKYKTENNFSKIEYNDIVNFGSVFIDFLLTALKSEDMDDNPSIRGRVEKCDLVLREISKALEILDDNSDRTNIRILSRCRVFKAEMKKLLVALKKGIEDEELAENQNDIEVKNDLPQNKFFNHIMQKGKDILDNRSILYRTPNKTFMIQSLQSKNGRSGNKKTVNSFIRRLSALKLNFHQFHLQNSHHSIYK